jgi:hypothetical protein
MPKHNENVFPFPQGHEGYRNALKAMIDATGSFAGQLYYQTTVPAHFSPGELSQATCAGHQGKG